MDILGKRYLKGFRDGVARVARKGDAWIEQLVQGFGVPDASICE